MRHTFIAGVVLALFATAALAAGGTGTGKGNPPQAAKVAAAPMAPVSGMMIIHHRITDYAKWRPVFDGDKAKQEAAGLTNPHVYAGKDALDVWITYDMADEAKAKAFAKSKALKEAMQKAGVEGRPTISYLTPAK